MSDVSPLEITTPTEIWQLVIAMQRLAAHHDQQCDQADRPAVHASHAAACRRAAVLLSLFAGTLPPDSKP